MMSLKILHRIKEHAAPVYGLSAGRHSFTVFSASGDKFVTEWNVRNGKQEPFAARLEHPAYVVLLVRKFNVLVVANSIGGLHVINLENNREDRLILNHSGGIFDLKFDELNDILYAAGADGVFSVWQLPTFELMRSIKLCDGKLRRIALQPSANNDPPDRSESQGNSLIAVACGDGFLRILENVFFNELYTVKAHEDGVTSVAWHPHKPVIITGGKDAHLRVWNVRNGFAEILSLPAHNFAIYAIAFSPDGLFMATASRDKTIKLWDANTLSPTQKIDSKSGGHGHSVNDLIWIDNETLVSCSDDRSILVFERQHG